MTPSITLAYPLLDTSLSYERYLADIPCVQSGTQNLILYWLVFIPIKCVYDLLNYLLINIVLLFCILLFLVVKKFWRKVTELCDKMHGLDKIMETLQRQHTFFYWCGVGQPFAFSLGMDSYKFVQSRAEYYIIILEEHFQVALEILEVVIWSSL
jgi:hypothetical protein